MQFSLRVVTHTASWGVAARPGDDHHHRDPGHGQAGPGTGRPVSSSRSPAAALWPRSPRSPRAGPPPGAAGERRRERRPAAAGRAARIGPAPASGRRPDAGRGRQHGADAPTGPRGPPPRATSVPRPRPSGCAWPRRKPSTSLALSEREQAQATGAASRPRTRPAPGSCTKRRPEPLTEARTQTGAPGARALPRTLPASGCARTRAACGPRPSSSTRSASSGRGRATRRSGTWPAPATAGRPPRPCARSWQQARFPVRFKVIDAIITACGGEEEDRERFWTAWRRLMMTPGEQGRSITGRVRAFPGPRRSARPARRSAGRQPRLTTMRGLPPGSTWAGTPSSNDATCPRSRP